MGGTEQKRQVLGLICRSFWSRCGHVPGRVLGLKQLPLGSGGACSSRHASPAGPLCSPLPLGFFTVGSVSSCDWCVSDPCYLVLPPRVCCVPSFRSLTQ